MRERIFDEDLWRLNSERNKELADVGILQTSPGTIAKFETDYYDSPSSESLTLDLVFHHTTIPVPRVRRVLHVAPRADVATVMDYIPGRRLLHVWPTLSFFAKLRVAFVLRGYVRQLRAVRHPRSRVPGPVGPDAEGRHIRCHMMCGYMDRRPRPLQSYSELTEWWTRMYGVGQERVARYHVELPFEPFDDSEPMVLTHCDINMRNVLVGDDGRLYLIDYAMSGFYPPWFEYVNWKYWLHAECGDEQAELDRKDYWWDLLIPFMSLGPYPTQERWFWRAEIGVNS